MVYPAVTLDSTSIGKYYYGAPPGRPQQLDINLSGDSDKLYQGLLSSPVYLSSLGARIIEACPDIGVVSFNHWHEGGVPVGFFLMQQLALSNGWTLEKDPTLVRSQGKME